MGKDEKAEPKMQVSEETMRAEGVPLGYRDYCAHLLIPLNKCRRKNYYLPFRCEDERHTYEKCQFENYMRRMENMENKVRDERMEAIRAREAKEAKQRGMAE